jgi:Aldehyde dehydrogenase family
MRSGSCTFGTLPGSYTIEPLAIETDDEAIKMANNTEFGLAAYFYSRDIGRIWRIAEALEYSIVGINEGIISTEIAPFGGMKESGIGRFGGSLGLEIRHRGIPRSQIPLHGRHRPLAEFGGSRVAVRDRESPHRPRVPYTYFSDRIRLQRISLEHLASVWPVRDSATLPIWTGDRPEIAKCATLWTSCNPESRCLI